jgi:putative hydrolase of the HAD superfamily
MTIRHLMFDFFGTMVHYRDGVVGNPVGRSLGFLRERGIDLDDAKFAARWQRAMDDIDREARATLREVHMHEGARRFLHGVGHEPDEATVAAFVVRYIDDWNEGVVDIAGLDRLLASIDLAASIVSNTFYPPLVPGHLARLGLRQRFAHVHTSIDHGYRKPHESIYRAALETAGVGASDVLFVGDNPACDYHGPRRLGMEAVLVSSQPCEGVPDRHRIPHIHALRGWLENRQGR